MRTGKVLIAGSVERESRGPRSQAPGITAGAALGLALAVAALGGPSLAAAPSRSRAAILTSGFTPAIADPRLAADLARRGVSGNTYRFTPADNRRQGAVRVAVRARASNPAEAARRAGDISGTLTSLTPTAYDLGVAIGWRGFAVSGDVARMRGGPVPIGREAAGLGLSYGGSRFTGRVEVGADRPDRATAPAIARATGEDAGYTVGVGGSYRIARNLDVTGGVRYRIPDERLQPLADQRRDSQAVYIGTAFRF